MADELVLFNVQHEEQGVVTQKICNIVILQELSDKDKLVFVIPREKLSIYKSFMGGNR